MSLQKNVVGWFEIPVADMERPIKFYEKEFNKDFYKSSSTDGALIYFSSQTIDFFHNSTWKQDLACKMK